MKDTQVFGIGLGAALLVLFNLPESAARGVKSGVRELLAPYHGMTLSASALFRRSAGEAAGGEAAGETPGGADGWWAEKRLEAVERENRALRELLGMRERVTGPAVACRVIARDGDSGWWRSVRLDRGSRAGIRVQDVVVAGHGLAGVVQEVTPHTAEVLLLSDPGFRVSVRCARTDAIGILQGGGVLARAGVMTALLPAEPAHLTYVPRGAEVRPGDELVTSGLGGVFPEGLPVGRVIEVNPAAGGLYLEGRVEPLAALDRMRAVLVLRGSGGEEGSDP